MKRPSLTEYKTDERHGIDRSQWKREYLTDRDLKESYESSYPESKKWYEITIIHHAATSMGDEFAGIFLLAM